MPIDPSRTVADLVIEVPARARVFERLGIDYCCAGKRSLAQACARKGADPAVVAAELETATGTGAAESVDWTAVPLADLCDHIVAAHHDRMRTELPRLSTLLEKVERAHGSGRPEFAALRTTFESMRAELEAHMAQEEAEIFPACRAGSGLDPAAAHELEHEHEATGAALERMRELTHGFDPAHALCNTHRATLDGLRELELDVHQHVHEENNILFPRALAA